MRPLFAPLAVAVALAAVCSCPGADQAPAPKRDDSDPTEAEVRESIQKYLADKSGRKATGAAVPNKTPWVWCREQYMAATAAKQAAKALYGLVGEHLAIADKYLKAKSAEERRKGLGMASEACQCASLRLKDKALAYQICDGYLLPHLDDADPRGWKYLSKEQVVEVIVDVYAQAEDAPRMIEALRLLIDACGDDRNSADAARFRLAQILARQKEYAEAVRQLKAIDPESGVGNAKNLIPEYEKHIPK